MTDETASRSGTAGGNPPTGTGPSEHEAPGSPEEHTSQGPQPGQAHGQPGPQPGPQTGPQPGPYPGPQSGQAQPTAGTATVRPPLRRSVTDRKVAGVCGGLGRHLDVDPVIFRVLFAVFAFFGGASVLLYGLGWLLIPADDQEQSEGQRLMAGRGDGNALAAVVAVVLGFAMFVGFLTGGWDGTFLLILVAAVVFTIVWAQNRSRARAAAGGWQPQAGWTPPGTWAPTWWQQPGPPNPSGSAGATGSAGTAAFTGTAGPAGPTGTAAYAPPTGGPAYGSPPGGIPPAGSTYPYEPPPRAPRRPASALPWIVISVALIAAGALVATGMSGVESITTQVVLATVLIVIGAGLVVGTWFGRARSLIGLGSVVTIVLVTVSTYSIPLRGGFGERDWSPATPAAVESPYRLTGGQTRLDLTQLDPQGGTVKIEATVVFGELRVRTDDDVRLVVHARAGMGNVILPNGRSDGMPAERDYTVDAVTGGDSKGTIELTLRVGMGSVEVDRVAA